MDFNRVMILGRLTRDPELKSLPSGKTVTTFGVATGRAWTDAQVQKQKQTEFHNLVLWSKLGEIANQYLKKGSRVFLEGRLQTRDWTGQDGVKRYRTEIVAENMIMLDSRPSMGAAEPAMPSAPSEPVNIPMPGGAAEVVEEEIKVEDIPF